MLDLGGRGDEFTLAVGKTYRVIKEFGGKLTCIDVAVTVDSGRKDGSPVLGVIFGEVRTSTEEAHAKWGPCDDHEMEW